MQNQQEYSSCPRFIYVDNHYLKFDIVQDNPKLVDLISDNMNEDTAIVVTATPANYKPLLENKNDRGIIYVDRKSFGLVINRIWTFVDSYQKGSPIRKSVLTLINLLEGEKTQ